MMDPTKIQIIKGVEMPNLGSGPGRSAHYPWKTMEIGDMFLFSLSGKKENGRHQASIAGRLSGRKFATRTLTPEQLAEMGIESDVPRLGCWRVE